MRRRSRPRWWLCVHGHLNRPQIYLTEQSLDADVAEQDARAVIEETAGICAEYPDWAEWLDRVRSGGADARLRSLGL